MNYPPRTDTVHTRWGTANVTRPGGTANCWLHLPTGWAGSRPTGHRQNNLGGYLFTSMRQAKMWLAPYEVPAPTPEPEVPRGSLPRRDRGFP